MSVQPTSSAKAERAQNVSPRRHLRLVWVICGMISLGLGIVGIFQPVLPTTPLVLLAAFCFGKGSPRLHAWILAHPRFGPAIQDWENTGAVPKRVKLYACAVMAATFFVCVLLKLDWRILVTQGVLMGIGATYVLTRPDR